MGWNLRSRVIGPYLFESAGNSQGFVGISSGRIKYQVLEKKKTHLAKEDGAPFHFGITVRDSLNDHFTVWKSRRATVEWPARSPSHFPI